eukprot:NODE_11913_length_1258_cov_4.179487.p1 GENE.NODE_11913_length_1258_cov_4.179487~~NODE_11913_length_1258_cov_4.179487.p1  ORF type:complete len:243 (-),score=72.00 NODE_11913_length_1258_cov_4.179487:353-1081(-)
MALHDDGGLDFTATFDRAPAPVFSATGSHNALQFQFPPGHTAGGVGAVAGNTVAVSVPSPVPLPSSTMWQDNLDDDEEFARELAEDLRLTSVAEPRCAPNAGASGGSADFAWLPQHSSARGGTAADCDADDGSALPNSGRGGHGGHASHGGMGEMHCSAGQSSHGGPGGRGADDVHYSVEYIALDSDGEDLCMDTPHTGDARWAPAVCKALLGLFRYADQRSAQPAPQCCDVGMQQLQRPFR